jgi:thiol-disulfide isomerase/thioredoxin
MPRGWIKLLVCVLSILGVAGSTTSAWAQAADAKTGAGDTPTAETILRRTGDFFKQARAFSFEVERLQKTGDATVKTTFTVDFQRPNRFAFRNTKEQAAGTGATFGVTLVSDGKKLFVAIPALKKYTEADAPASFDAVLTSDPIVAGMLPATLTICYCFCTEDPYAKLMEGVTMARKAGIEMFNGTRVYRLTFTQDQFDWELWVAADGDPIVHHAVIDYTKMVARMPGAFEQLKGQKVEIVQNYRSWRFGPDFDEKTFAFEPPKGAAKVDSFLAGLAGGGPQEISPLVGRPAPDVDLKRLDGGDFRLQDHRDAHLVMLDFWATWCGPCVQELPILAEVSATYKDKDVVFCGVNVREKPDTIRPFLKDKKLDFTVALDTEGQVGEAYNAQAIPMLVLIDKKGIVQAVHIGYNPAIKGTLTKELDDILAGKDLAKEALAKRDAEKAKIAAETKGLEPAWSVGGPYTGVAADPGGQALFALQRGGRCDVLDRAGHTTRTVHLADNGHSIIRFARLAGSPEGLLGFSTWGQSVLASKGDGTKLWEETGGQGIDDVWAADLDGDGSDEVIVGYNGGTGLHVFGGDGKRLWKRTDLANVWHVAAGDLDGDGKLEVVTTSARGKVHVSAATDGRDVRTLSAGVYANMVRLAPRQTAPAGAPQGDVVLVVGTGQSGPVMVALGGDGKTLWTLELPANVQSCDSLAVTSDGAWAALGLRGGRVSVVDVRNGQILAQTAGKGMTPMVAWAAGDATSPPLLLVATGSELNAFRVKPE